MIDIHMLHTSDERADWANDAVNSITSQNVPVNLRHLDGIAGDIATMRIQGWLAGTSEYLAWVDSDDILLPGAIESCVSLLEKDKALVGAYTNFARMSESGVIGLPAAAYHRWSIDAMRKNRMQVYQFTVLRRKHVTEALKLGMFPDKLFLIEQILVARIARWGDLAATNTLGYLYRINPNGACESTDVNVKNSGIANNAMPEYLRMLDIAEQYRR